MRRIGMVVIGLALVFSGCGDDGSPTALDLPAAEDPVDAPANEVEWSAAGEMLRQAAELIEEHGWQQGATEPVEQYCAATALEAAFLNGNYSVVDFNYARAALARQIGVPREVRAEDDEVIAVPYWGRELMDWNDAAGRSEDEVIETFVEAADQANALSEEAGAQGP